LSNYDDIEHGNLFFLSARETNKVVWDMSYLWKRWCWKAASRSLEENYQMKRCKIPGRPEYSEAIMGQLRPSLRFLVW